MEKETNLTLYNLFDEIDLDSNTSIDLSNEEKIEEITPDDFENCIDHIDVNISLDARPDKSLKFGTKSWLCRITITIRPPSLPNMICCGILKFLKINKNTLGL